MKKWGLVYSLSDEEFRLAVANSVNGADLLRKLGFKCVGGSACVSMKKRIKELDIDISHWDFYHNQHHNYRYVSNEEYFSEEAPHSGGHLTERILKYNLIEYKCSMCGDIGIWNDKLLTLQVDHINGNHSDNRISNLRFLCPNCHSQTTTFAGRNIKHKH